MKIYKNSTAVTLFELIMATTVVGIIILGVVTANVSLQKMGQDSNASYYVVQRTMNILSQILNDASKASGTPSCPGIIIGDGSANNPPTGTFCIYKPDSSKANIPRCESNAVGQWVCYTLPAAGQTILSCNPTPISSVPTAACSTASTLGAVKKLTPLFSNNNFQLTVEACLNSAVSSCCDPSVVGCVPDTNNPYVKKMGSMVSSMHSAG